MNKYIVVFFIALLLGAHAVRAQDVAIFAPRPVSALHGPVACEVKGLKIFDEASCLVLEMVLKGRVLPYGPTEAIMADVNYVCQKGFDGFMDHTYQGAIRETRESYFNLVGFACFKQTDSKGVAQEPGPWIEEVRELVSETWRPKTPPGAAPVRAARSVKVRPSSFRTSGTKVTITLRP